VPITGKKAIPMISLHMQEPGEDGKEERKVFIKPAQTASLGDGPRVLGDLLLQALAWDMISIGCFWEG